MTEVLAPTGASAPMNAIAVDLAAIHHAIAREARSAGRLADVVKLVCVSKTVEAARVEAALAAGARRFGENRVQEAKTKWTPLRKEYPDVELHLIGPLQTNKVREALQLFDVIETVDRPRLAEALAEEIARAGRHPRLFVEVNIGAEPQKAGILPNEADAFLKSCREEYGLTIEGLMCVPPEGEPASPYFALLRVIAEHNGLKELSMGMSADYLQAVQVGATYVRIGTAIFGARTTV